MAATFSDVASSAKELLSSVQVTLRAKPSPSCSADNSGNPDTSEANRHGSVIFRVANEDSSRINMIDMDGEPFTFDHVKWADESQEQVYKAAAHSLVEESLRGYNATILAYGAAQTGKSYTMGTLVPMMDKDCQANGLIQRSLEHIFEHPEIQVSASVVEIYSEEVYDLLNHGVKLTVCDGKASDARIKSIKSLERGFHLVKRALHLRREHSTFGSQSHVVLTLHLKIKNGQNYFESKLNLIDLAGSKQPTGAESKDLSEGCCFEESLSALARVMVKKSKTLKDLFSGNSTLTSVLKDSLNAKCLISLIACVSLETDDHKENLRTLLFADVARSMKIEPQSGVTSGSVESELNTPSGKLGSVSPAGSPQTGAIVTENTFELSTERNVKNCIVVLKQCEIDSYERDKEPQKCEESGEPNNETTRTPPRTNSTVSISRLETPNPENKNFQRITTDEHTWTCFEDSCSISPVAANSTEQLHNLGEEEASLEYYLECSCPCQCPFPGSPRSGDQAGRSAEEAAAKIQLALADNVSQLSICSEEEAEIPVYWCGQGGCSSRSENDTNDDMHQLQRLEMMRRFEVIKRMKRRSGPSSTVDFSEPGPSGASTGPTPSKIQKFEDDSSGSKLHNLQGPCKPDKSGSEDEKDCVDDKKGVKNVLNGKQKAQNEYILRVLNSCVVKHLQMLPRIGAKTAMSIYQYRSIHGEFKSLKDLKNLPMWTPNLFNKFLTANNVTLE